MTADVVAFLRAALDEVERVAGAATPGPWVDEDGKYWHLADRHVYGRGITPEHLTQVCSVEHGATPRPDTRHIALHDPRAALARVQAERAVLASYDHADQEYRRQDRGVSPDYLSGQLAGAYAAVLDLAHGHRYTVPGFDPAWAPEGVSADA